MYYLIVMINKITKTCEICNGFYETYKKTQKYCSRKCAEVAKIGRKNPGRSNRLTKKCDWCGNVFSRPASNFHSKHFFCCHSCSAKWWTEYGLRGEKHSKWNGGQYKAYTDGWKPLRKKAIKRAKNKCQRCSNAGRLEVHHKKPVNRCFDAKEANKLSNVIVVCPKCHVIEEKISKEKYPQIPLFHL